MTLITNLLRKQENRSSRGFFENNESKKTEAYDKTKVNKSKEAKEPVQESDKPHGYYPLAAVFGGRWQYISKTELKSCYMWIEFAKYHQK